MPSNGSIKTCYSSPVKNGFVFMLLEVVFQNVLQLCFNSLWTQVTHRIVGNSDVCDYNLSDGKKKKIKLHIYLIAQSSQCIIQIACPFLSGLVSEVFNCKSLQGRTDVIPITLRALDSSSNKHFLSAHYETGILNCHRVFLHLEMAVKTFPPA